MGDASLAVQAYAFAATIQPKTIESLLPASAERVRLTKTIAIVRYGPTSWVVVHDFGAVVFVDIEAAERERVLKTLRGLVGDEPHPPLEETYTVEVAPGATSSVGFERVVVGELDGRTVGIIALVVAQSVAMEYYETDVDELVAALEKRSRQLAADGALHGRARDLMRFIGRGMTMRSSVILTLSLLESPGITWENETLDRLYRGLRASFEIEERYRALDDEIRIVQDDLALMVDMVRQRRFIFLEVVVAVFVVVEALAFLGELLLRR